MVKLVTRKQYAFASLLFRVFFDPLLALLLANSLGGSVSQFAWLGGHSYWMWVGIVLLIQTLWGTDTQTLVIEPYKSLKQRIKEKESNV